MKERIIAKLQKELEIVKGKKEAYMDSLINVLNGEFSSFSITEICEQLQRFQFELKYIQKYLDKIKDMEIQRT